jgi:benzoyl-CoA reductase subunit C
MEAILRTCRERLVDALPPGDGTPRVGCFPVYAPVEVIHAAGALPVSLAGAGSRVELTSADAYFASFVCSIAKSTLELGLRGHLKSLQGVFFHSICDVARNLASVFARNFPSLHVEYIHYPQGNSPAAAAYYRAELERVGRNLAAWTGREATVELLRGSLALYNGLRGELRALYDLRCAEPDRLATAEFALLSRAAVGMPPEAALSMLSRARTALADRLPTRRDRVRVVVEGAFCEQPPLELLEAVEEAGCAVVGDDLLVGWRWFEEDVPAGADPLSDLAEAYLNRAVHSSTRTDPARPRWDRLVEKVRAARADAVLFLPAKFCEPALLDYVPYREELDRAGIPHLVLEFDEKMGTFERARETVETFVESMLFA